MISSLCRSALPSCATGISGSSDRPVLRPTSVSRAATSFGRKRPFPPSATFSATVIAATSENCWCTIPMRDAIASEGELKICRSPSTASQPVLGRIRPNAIRIRVVFPAPFSPSSAWIVPLRTTSDAFVSAATCPNFFDSRGARALCCSCRLMASATKSETSRSVDHREVEIESVGEMFSRRYPSGVSVA